MSMPGHHGNIKANGEPFSGPMVNRRSVWQINPQPTKDAHFATFPEELVRICIQAGCPEKGVVLDPFFGSGTTGLVAKKLGLDYIGIELNPEYIKIAENRLKEVELFL